MKLWDIVSTWLPFDIEPTWSAPYRVQSFGTATWWFVAEFTIFAGLALLRIPRLSPTFLGLAGMLILWNAACYAVAAPGQILGLVPVGGPASLGVPWFRSIFKLLYDPTAADKGHITGVHRVRLLPFR
jgi:nucleoporin POM152